LESPGPEVRPSDAVAAAEPVPVASASVLSAPAQGPSPFVFKLVLSYASAVTLACLYLLYLLFQRSPTLDLPDLAPKQQPGNRVTTLLYVPPESTLPPAHRLRLGESRQFGSVRVTPVRVTRGPLHFTFFDPQANESHAPSRPVLKLHLRFENVSADQQFA